MTQISGSAQFVSLGQPGYALRAPGLVGSADLMVPAPAGTRGLRGGLATSLPLLDAVLAKEGVATTREIEVQLQAASGPAGAARSLRSADQLPALELEVPDPGPEFGQVVLSVDDAGALRWHLPVAVAPSATAGTSRAQGGTRRFLIPATLPPAPPAAVGLQQRSVFGIAARRLMKVLVYPWSDAAVGWAVDRYTSHWEARNRPHRLRRFSPADYQAASGTGLAPHDIAAMATAGPLLLFVHGTFSTAHGAFGDLGAATMAQLEQRYGGRVIAFDHPTLSASPAENARWLLQQLPAQAVRADIVCHSRGGLVSRLLAERPTAEGSPATLDVRTLVFAGVPNAGTLLSEPDHMTNMIDRLTTALSLLPGPGVSEAMEAIVTAVKVLGRGLLTGLDGLAAMRPSGAFLQQLNAGPASQATYCAIAADYEASDRGLRGLLTGAADNVLDLVFRDAANDLVVPTDGVSGHNGSPNFPIPPQRVLLLKPPGPAMHTRLFGEAMVGQRLLEWLV